MQGFSILKNVFNKIIDSGLTNKVFHSVIRFTDDKGESMPIYPLGGDEFGYIGYDDKKYMTVYCRQTGELRNTNTEKIGGCGVSAYRVTVPQRIVVYNDFDSRDHSALQSELMQFVFLPNVRLLSLMTDKQKLASQEGNVKGFMFGEETLYFAIDFEISFRLSRENCEQELHDKKIVNPYCG